MYDICGTVSTQQTAAVLHFHRILTPSEAALLRDPFLRIHNLSARQLGLAGGAPPTGSRGRP